MFPWSTFAHLALITACFSFLSNPSLAATFCKSYPGSPGWPSPAHWQSLNETLSYRLLQPLPPAAVCHPNEPVYNNASCALVAAEWTNSTFHAENPISVDDNYWTNDSCLPTPLTPCSGEAYPVYVVDAATPDHVKIGIDFARRNNIRLVVKGTGHDYLGRSIAPYSLSIWTYHMRGLDFHQSFQPQGCRYSIDTSAVTVAAGEPFGDIYTAAAALNQTVVGPVPATIGIGGYLSGGGHSPISGLFGLGSDQVLEMNAVTASGNLLTVNECQNTDLFWALRGGGGSTFGVITSVTIKTFPTMPIASLTLSMYSEADSAAYWGANAYLLSQSSHLIQSGVYGYVFTGGSVVGLVPNTSTPASIYTGGFLAPRSTSAAVADLFAPIINHINTTWPGKLIISVSTADFPDYYSWWIAHTSAIGVGIDLVVGSRLLDGDALASPQNTLVQTLQETTPPGGLINVNLIAGPGVWSAAPRGGSDSVHPAWRKAYVEFVTSATWTPLNATQKDAALEALTQQYLPTLTELAGPNPGCYINEADPYDTGFPQVFWGDNYPRLLSIKRRVDPDDVFWCLACVGRGGWHQTDQGLLCRD